MKTYISIFLSPVLRPAPYGLRQRSWTEYPSDARFRLASDKFTTNVQFVSLLSDSFARNGYVDYLSSTALRGLIFIDAGMAIRLRLYVSRMVYGALDDFRPLTK